jgi:hypothetical protein
LVPSMGNPFEATLRFWAFVSFGKKQTLVYIQLLCHFRRSNSFPRVLWSVILALTSGVFVSRRLADRAQIFLSAAGMPSEGVAS